MKLKRLLSLVCALALLFTAVPGASAATSPTLTFTNNSVTIGSGSSAYCYLRMNNAENISAMDYMIIYDAENLELSSIANTGFSSQSDVTISVNKDEPGIIRVTLISTNGLSGSNYLNLMYFKAKADAKPGTYPITVLVTDMYDGNLETVIANVTSGTITVKEATVKNVSFSGTLAPTTVEVGESVACRVSASGLNSLAAGTLEFTYDDAKLRFKDMTLSTAMQSTVYDINNSISGLVKLNFASDKAITSGSNLAVLNFEAIAAGNADISFKPSELYSYDFQGMTGSTFTKTVTIEEAEIIPDYPDMKIILEDEAFSDKEFTVKAYLEGGSGVRAGDFTISYDTSVLECTSVSAETISGAWLAVDKNFSSGQARFSLMSNVDIAEDTALVKLTFRALENKDFKTQFSVSGTDVFDAGFIPVQLEYVPCEVEGYRPEYTVNFYDSDGNTLLASQKVMSGEGVTPPATEEIRTGDLSAHLKFSGWDKDCSSITADTDITAVYKSEAHTEITQNGTAATCTEPGITDGKYCIVCDAILIEQTTIPANGHNEVKIPAVAPGFDSAGSTEGASCDVCGTVTKTPTEVPPTGPIVNAILTLDGTLTVSGGITDVTAASGKVYVAVYDKDGKMLALEDITTQNQSDFSASRQEMTEAATIRVLRWSTYGFRPANDVIEKAVIKE